MTKSAEKLKCSYLCSVARLPWSSKQTKFKGSKDASIFRYKHGGYEHFRISDPKPRDIRKFFASIDQATLLRILRGYIPDERTTTLLSEVVSSFCSCCTNLHTCVAIATHVCRRKGLPLGNLTSQLLVNVYMNEFDQYVKHSLKMNTASATPLCIKVRP